jgi:hypothetical protein
MRFSESIEVKQNLHLVARERGKIVARRDGHNIFCNTGREWLAKLVCYASMSPLTPERNDRVRYMGLGIGGTRQLALTTANAAPLLTAYPGDNLQTDTDPTITVVERPVRVSGGSSPGPVGAYGDVWLGQIQADTNTAHPTPTSTTFKRVFLSTEVSYFPFNTVPLSEIGLFTAAADPLLGQNVLIAYDTFDTLSKTVAIDLEVTWTLRF